MYCSGDATEICAGGKAVLDGMDVDSCIAGTSVCDAPY